ncbi:hypothetical protein [Paraburkholderia rhizosphaerae]|uniref:Uncharacterized protein n=1 Tax=Paraburkholderia rhizosphaerae TaxID=480658 RepID=A0A4R8LMB1_9BURK|nr:hypothetical protein [Paraburkholderia rhizosphaerae]TDY46481.1 hypothetical protein BX592_113109 [Paraburkholderia rhizosphaerae]
MAGVKGRSGGPRANSGGVRPGAGRPKKSKPAPTPLEERDMLQLLQDIALGRVDATPIQVRAAVEAVRYTHARKGESGKKAEKAESAKAAASKFGGVPPPPRMIVNNMK